MSTSVVEDLERRRQARGRGGQVAHASGAARPPAAAPRAPAGGPSRGSPASSRPGTAAPGAASARARGRAGRSACSVGPSRRGQRVRAGQRRARRASAPGRPRSVARMLGSWPANVASTALESLTKRASSVVAGAELLRQEREVVDDAADVAPPLGQPGVDLAQRRAVGLERPDRVAEVVAAAAQAAGAGRSAAACR